MVARKYGEDGFDCTGCTQEMAHGAFGARHVDLGSVSSAFFAEQQPLDRSILRGVAELGRCGMGIDIVNLARFEMSVLQGLSHRQVRARTVFLRRSHMECI